MSIQFTEIEQLHVYRNAREKIICYNKDNYVNTGWCFTKGRKKWWLRRKGWGICSDSCKDVGKQIGKEHSHAVRMTLTM